MKKLGNYRIILLAMLTLVLLSFSTTNGVISANNDLKQKTSAFEPYQFIIFGDTRNAADGNNAGMEIVAGLMTDLLADDSLNIKFAVHSGDAVNVGPDQDEWDTYYWPHMTAINDTIPIYMTVGNHEIEGTTMGDDPDLVVFKSNVNNPGNEVWFSFDTPQNDIHFIFINTELFDYGDTWDKDPIKLQAQADWLAADVAANTIDQVVLVMHRPLWGVNPGREQDYEDFRALFRDEAIETGADLIINGHDHYGYYTVRNHSTGGEAGYSHVLVNGGGTPFLNKPIPDYFNPALNPTGPGTLLSYDFCYEGNEICLANVTEDGMYIDMIGADGSVVFSFNTVDDPPNHVPFVVDTTTDMTTTTTTADESPTSTPGFELEIVIASFAGIIAVITYRKKYRK